MDKKLFDTSWIIGALFSIIGVAISLYTTTKEIKIEYILAGVLLLTISIGVLLLIRVFLNTKEKLLEMDKKINQNAENIIDLNKRFITLEDLNDIRLDIRELKRMCPKDE